jgi:hypothetical protein
MGILDKIGKVSTLLAFLCLFVGIAIMAYAVFFNSFDSIGLIFYPAAASLIFLSIAIGCSLFSDF